jgi:hypothetical protein
MFFATNTLMIFKRFTYICPSHQNGKEERPTLTALLPQGSKPPRCSLRSVVWFHLSHSWVDVSHYDDIHVIEKVKGCLFPWFCCKQTQSHPSWIQINKPSTKHDRIHACHCMNLPTASQNTQYCRRAGCWLACSMASAKMALFAEASSLRFNHAEALSVHFDIHHHCHDHDCTMIKRWRDAPSICVGWEVIAIHPVELERKTRKKN